jgi:hypothetical protein
MLYNTAVFVGEYLKLEKPFNIVLKSRPSIRYKNASGLYRPHYRNGVFKSHLIHVFIYNTLEYRCLDTIIAHELIHAWQEEKGMSEIHGKRFISMAKRIEKVFGLKNIYIEGVDL